MLEIIFVIGLCKALGNMLRAKGRNPLWMQVMLVVFWIGGELAGGIVAGILHAITKGPEAPMGIGVYLIAICGAAIGAGVTFLIAYLLPSLNYEATPTISSSNPFGRHIDSDNPYAR